jgi:hypothetical protein
MGVVAPFVIRTPDQEPDRPAHAQGKDVVRSVDHSGQPPGKARGVYGQPRGRFYTVVWLNCVRRPKSRRRHWSIHLGGWRIEASITAPRENPTPAARQAAANPSVAPAESERIDTCAASGSLGSGR